MLQGITNLSQYRLKVPYQVIVIRVLYFEISIGTSLYDHDKGNKANSDRKLN